MQKQVIFDKEHGVGNFEIDRQRAVLNSPGQSKPFLGRKIPELDKN